MKSIFLVAFVLFGLSATLSAQSTTTKNDKAAPPMAMEDGVAMIDGKMMLFKNNVSSPLKKTYKCDDGCKVAVDGTVTKPDGMTVKLKEGQGLDKHGHMSMAPTPEMALTPHKCTSACSASGCAYVHGEKGHTCTDACKKKM